MPFDYIIDPDRTVGFSRSQVPLKDVPLGREFVDGQRRYQASTKSALFSTIGAAERFRVEGTWYEKNGQPKKAHRLWPNSPFGAVSTAGTREFSGTDNVDLLVVSDRGPV